MERAKPVYTIAYVELAEGVKMMTNIVNCDPNSVKIGMAVTAEIAGSGEEQKFIIFRAGDRS
mgnify:CR=1 FL=1